jgi:hypothetical protein
MRFLWNVTVSMSFALEIGVPLSKNNLLFRARSSHGYTLLSGDELCWQCAIYGIPVYSFYRGFVTFHQTFRFIEFSPHSNPSNLLDFDILPVRFGTLFLVILTALLALLLLLIRLLLLTFGEFAFVDLFPFLERAGARPDSIENVVDNGGGTKAGEEGHLVNARGR